MRLTYTAKLTLSMAIPTAMVAGAGGCVFVGATWLAGLAASLPPGAIAGHLRLGAIGIAGLTVLCVATCIGVTMWIRRAAHRELGTDPERARRLLAEIAAGNLAVGVGSAPAGSVLDSIAGLSSHLNGLLTQIRSASESVDVASREVAAGNMDLSHRTEVAAGQLQQVASSMSRVAETVRHNADAAREASRMAAMAGDVAGKGGEVVSQVVSTMGAIESSSREIAEIIATVDGLAFQTNILALNAAVEAARAGEQGRGFAVVASEVRALAGRSAEAARSIKTLITASVERVDAGSRLVQDAGATMDEIVASVQRVSAMIERISGTTEEQSDGIGRVGGAVEQIDQMTQQNAALVEQSAAVAESLKDQAAKLHQVVETFHLRSG